MGNDEAIALHEDSALIDKLGGTAALARMIGCPMQRVSNWRVRGIPAQVKLDHPQLFLAALLKKVSA